jgi:hypothetical protein
MSEDRPLLERIRRLEGELEQWRQERSGWSTRDDALEQGTAPRAVWPADELLLARLLRRTPAAIGAYEAGAELTPTADGRLRLSRTESRSPYRFCELSDGDAVVWLAPDPPDWLWDTQVFRRLFHCVEGTSARANLVLQRLPSFLPVVRGRSWSLHHSGELVPRSRLSDARQERDRLLSRLERLERLVMQGQAQDRAALEELRTELRTQRELLDRLLALLRDQTGGASC